MERFALIEGEFPSRFLRPSIGQLFKIKFRSLELALEFALVVLMLIVFQSWRLSQEVFDLSMALNPMCC
jgi:hypothetical protein